ncbi:MAG: ImmA/IrrE family metallo-endopeptidase [Pseudobacteriovorax sp.]|nr:ImmA/IrrE family metallo-endopeptidase [Pseudobacteriovorax sp.]
MKKVEANRYPHSATLFRFCKEALEIRYEGNVKVIDQDVGAILGYDPADCSHWKKGKKNIRALATLKSIADHLNIDERLLIDIASGKVDLEEAVFEFRGYGSFNLTGKSLDTLKKDYFKNPGKWQEDSEIKSFEELFDINRPAVAAVANEILEMGNFSEAPIYIPEVFQLFPNINLISSSEVSTGIIVKKPESGGDEAVEIHYKGDEMRPYIRFLIAKELYKYLCEIGHSVAKAVSQSPKEVIEIQSNIFAGMLLIPAKVLRTEVEKIDSSIDIVSQLAETFWVSKALLNQRLRDYLENLN